MSDENPRGVARYVAPVRAFVFPDMSRALLLHFPESADSVQLPAVALPLSRSGVYEAFRASGIEARVAETVPGRWTTALQKAKRDERSERGQRVKLAEATAAALMRQAPSLCVQQRAEAMQRKHAVDDEARRLKTQIGEAKSRACTRGDYMNPASFRALERRLEELKQESQALQGRLGELRKQEKIENAARDKREKQEKKMHGTTRERMFVEASKRVVDKDTYLQIWDEVNSMIAESDDLDDAES